MIYDVRARLKAGTAAELLARLTDGSIKAQRPDGGEIVAAMKRAVVGADGTIAWSEMCFCDPPLAHERATVLDRYFDGLTTAPVADYLRHQGRPLMDHLAELAARDG
jgi:hypothetical protein